MIEFDFETLHHIGFNHTIASALAALPATASGARLMRVIDIQRGGFTIHDGNHDYTARALPALIAQHPLAVGDWVVAELKDFYTWWISQYISTANQIARRGNDGRRQQLASNIDTALLSKYQEIIAKL